ncbi:MAG: hypothetical protein NZ740_06525 [Kiritimatiellae bacterium]|nr:hypothetical protein [Kiritimatiellia bacterium]MDW8458751.1 hypothetical protein [Verrucomicrobiota bacterium]
MKRVALSLLSVVVLTVGGCATPEARIRANPEAFQALPPEIRENVRQGKIDLGYPKEAVRIALGPPDRQYRRRTADGESEVWSYIAVRSFYERQRADARVRVYDPDGRRRVVNDWVWVDVERRQEYDRMRVEFRDDRVTAIETVDR